MKILLAVDGSPYTQKMLDYLTSHQELFSVQNAYTVLTVHAALPPHARAAVGKEATSSYYTDETQKVLAPVVSFLAAHGINAKSDSQIGPLGQTIARFADEGHFDLVVMGSHGLGALANLVMGSVATQVLAQCTVPVLLVR